MKLNKIIFMLFISLMLLSLSSVSAENVNSTDSDVGISDDLTDVDIIGVNEDNAIYVDINGIDSNSGTEKSQVRTIKKAIDLSDDNATIYLSDGVFSGNLNSKLNISKSLTFVGGENTQINGLGENYLFEIMDNVTVTFKNIKFVNAYKAPESYSVSYNSNVYGAALDIKNAKVTIENCSFVNNVITYGSRDNYVYGGAISNFGDLTIINSYFTNNTALSTSGLFSYGGSIYNKGKLSIHNSTFLKSYSVDFGYGATIANDGKVIMQNSIISQAKARHETKGSAIYNTGDFKLYNSIVENNYIERSSFNYIYGVVYNSGNLTAAGCIFTNNTGYYESPMPAYKGSPNIYNSGLLNLSYNAFIDNAPFDGINKDIFFNGGDIVSLDNNWWNSNENPYETDSINVDRINSWLILNLTPSYSKLNVSDSVLLEVSWTNNINSLPQINLIPIFNVTFKTEVNGNQIISKKQLINGNANFEFNYTQNKGSYEVNASLESFTQSALVDVGKVLTYISYDVDDNVTYLEDVTVNVEVISADGSIPTGLVLLDIGDETYTVNLVNGKGSCTISQLTPQKYTLNMAYEGSENHFKAFNQTDVNIKKLDVELAINIPEIKVGQKGQAIVTLSPKGVQGQAILYVDGVRKKIVYLYNGNTTISMSNFAEGKYNISLEFVENAYYNSANISGILNVTRYDSAINISAEDIKVGQNATITVKVSPDSLRGEATLVINGVDNTIFIDDAITNVTLTNLEAGSYNVTLIFDGDLRYYSVNASTSFKVLRTPVNLTVDIVQDDKNLNGTIKVRLNSTECSGTVGVYVNYDLYTLNVTDGEAEFDVKFDKGTNYVFVFYEGDRYFDDASWNITLGVADEFVFIGENSTGFAGNDFNYSVRLIEINGIPMPGRTVTIQFNDKKYNVTTNDEGYAFFKLNLAEGNYSISANYKNTTIYNNLQVKKVDFNLSANSISYGEREMIKAVFEDDVNGNVTFIIADGMTVCVEIINRTAVYNSTGLDVGNYTVTAIYNNITHDAKFTVSKSDLKWQINVNPATPYVDEIINVTNLAGASGEVIFIFNNAEYEVAIKNNEALLNLSKLNEGSYSITVKYAGDNNYLPANKTVNFYVKEFASDLTLHVNDAPYASDLIAVAVLNGDATGIVRFNVSNITKEIDIVDGKAIWNFTGLDVGNYTITANYLGNDYYIESENETSFSVFKANSTINLYVKEVSLGENIRIYADLSPNATGSVSFSMIGYFSPRNKPISNSLSTWYIAPLNTGEYTVIAKYLGDKNYYASNTTYILNVSQRKTILDVELNDAGMNDRVICKVSMKTKDGFALTDTVTLRMGGNVYDIEVTDGTGSLVLGKLAVGNYDYTVEYVGSENFTEASYEGSFKVVDDLLSVNLTCNNLTKYYGGSDRLVISLKNSNGNAFASQIITVKIASKKYTLVTDSNGEASLDVDFNPGSYDASVIFEETSKYKSASKNVTINVLSTVEGIDVVKLYGSGTQYFAVFVDSNGKALGNTEVTFKISGNSYKLTTMPNGVAKINVNFKVGTYVISTVNPVTDQKLSNKITIYYYIEGKDSSNNYGTKTNYKVRIYSAYQKPVGAGKVVKFKVNGKTYSVKTDKNGYAKLAVKLLPKKYTVTVTYSKYKISNKITVKCLLSAKDVTKKKSKTTKFQAKLINSKGKVQKGKKITFKIDGKKYTAITNKKGIAAITIKTTLKVGKHKIYSSFGNNKITNTITITK